MSEFDLNINGARFHVNAPEDESLLSVLRNRLNLTGTKYGCGEGECGACTVLAEDQAVLACMVSASSAAGQKIVTIEGLAVDGKLTPLQQAFVHEEAMQCGFCTSGMIMNATALLHSRHKPTHEEVLDAMDGNICRCGTYPRILAAIRRAAGEPEDGGDQ